MQQFILEEHLDIIVSESGGETIDEFMHLERMILLELCSACIKLIRVEHDVW